MAGGTRFRRYSVTFLLVIAGVCFVVQTLAEDNLGHTRKNVPRSPRPPAETGNAPVKLRNRGTDARDPPEDEADASDIQDGRAALVESARTSETSADSTENKKRIPSREPPVPFFQPYIMGSLLLSTMLIKKFPVFHFVPFFALPFAYLYLLSLRETSREREHENVRYLEWLTSHDRAAARRRGLQELMEGKMRPKRRPLRSSSQDGARRRPRPKSSHTEST